MFNGIIYNIGKVKNITKKNNSINLEIFSTIKLNPSNIGSSISCNGVCLTLVRFKKNILNFYLSPETLKKSNFQYIKIGDSINIEQSLIYGQQVSGSFIQGHVDTVGIVKEINIIDKSWIVKIGIPKKYTKMLVEKASIGINGVSLTISRILRNSFEITIIPHTLKFTNLIKLRVNNTINIEIDILSKYLKKLN